MFNVFSGCSPMCAGGADAGGAGSDSELDSDHDPEFGGHDLAEVGGGRLPNIGHRANKICKGLSRQHLHYS